MEQNINPQNTENETKSSDPTVSIIVIVLILFIGAYFFFYQRIPSLSLPSNEQNSAASRTIPEPDETSIEETDFMISEISQQGISDDLSEIEKDIDATIFGSPDEELQSI